MFSMAIFSRWRDDTPLFSQIVLFGPRMALESILIQGKGESKGKGERGLESPAGCLKIDSVILHPS